MKHVVLLIWSFIFTCTLSLFAQQTALQKPAESGIEVLGSSATGLDLRVVVSGYELRSVKTPGGEFNRIELNNSAFIGEAGKPFLPVLSQLIQIPEKATVQIDISKSTYTDYAVSALAGNNFRILPFQPGASKSDTEPAPFYLDAATYNTNQFIQPGRAKAEITGSLRNMRMARLEIFPFDYNPVTNVLRVYDELVLSITFPGADIPLTRQVTERYADFCFSSAGQYLLNGSAFSEAKDTATHYPVKYVIVADTMFQSALQPFVDWKIKKGFMVEKAFTSNPAVGNTTTSISNYLQGLYDNATTSDPAPSFILIVGDVAQVPAFSGTTGSHVTDMYYAEFTGDMIPDAYFGRFSATTVPELQSQINKTLEYEQYLFPSETWLDTVVMIAGADPTYGPTHANGQINYGTTYYFNPTQGLYSYTHLYPASQNEDAQIRTEIGRGVSYANYTAHGYEQGWGDPSFDVSDIDAMMNAHQYPLMIGNACLTNSFQQSVCFGEALLRADLKGAIGYIGGSNSTYWNEDFYWGVGVRSTINANPVYDANNLGAYDRLWHITGEPFSEWFTSQGQMILAGNLAVLEGSPSSFDYYSEIYHLMGDPSLMVYLGVPSQLSVTHPALVPLGQSTISISTEPYAYVGISQNGIWHGAGLADASGIAVIDIIPFTLPGNADIVGTKQFRKPYISTFAVQSPTGPYVLFNTRTISDPTGNSNQDADYMETVDLNVNLKNYGLMNDSTVYAVLSGTDLYVEILDSIGIWGLIESDDTLTLNTAFTVRFDTLVPDQYQVPFSISVRDSSGNSWGSTFNVKVNAPQLQILGLTIDDVAGGNGNNKLDPGETANLNIEVLNAGHADIWDASALLTTTSPYLTITSATWQHDSLYTGISEAGHYSVSVDPATPAGTSAALTLSLDALTWYHADKTFTKSIGQVDEDWETGDLTQYAWATSGDAPWIITSGNPYEGAFAAVSGDIDDSETSVLQIDILVLSDDTLSFYKKVSSEEPYSPTYLWDYLDFSVNSTSKGQWGGEIGWSKESYLLSAGLNSLKWSYVKDYSVSGGSDAAWIDYIVFPPMVVVTSSEANLPTAGALNIYPNPASDGMVTITGQIASDKVVLNVFSPDGKCVLSQSYNTVPGQLYIPLSTEGWEPGLYLVTLSGAQESYHSSITVIY